MTSGAPGGIEELQDRTKEYLVRDLHAEGVWPQVTTARYGGVLFNGRGEVLLREPANHFDGYVWTFPKGAPEQNESTGATALREVLEETGFRPTIIGHLAEGFSGTSTGWVAFYYLMLDLASSIDEQVVAANGETASVRWVTKDVARTLIAETTNSSGRVRDLSVLDAAFDELFDLVE